MLCPECRNKMLDMMVASIEDEAARPFVRKMLIDTFAD